MGLGFVIVGIALGLARAFDVSVTSSGLADVHLLLVELIRSTTLGAMTQFVPVWSGTRLHSKVLANVQFVLTIVGVAGLALGRADASGWFNNAVTAFIRYRNNIK